MGFRFQVSGFKFQVSGFRFQVLGVGFRFVDGGGNARAPPQRDPDHFCFRGRG